MAMLLATSFLLLAICFIFLPFIASTRSLQDPELVVQEVNRELDASRRRLGYFSCGTGNSIDDCWRCDRNWANNRRRLADCSIGFGRSAIGGKYGKIYVVTDSTDKDAVNPKPGTLRYGVLQDEPLWIIFARDMVIKLKEELIMTSFKTLDGRGVHVEIAYGGCLTIQNVKHIIIHGLNIHDCAITGNAWVRSSMSHFGLRGKTDGDGITVFGSSHVWVDHCSLSKCKDGLIDVVAGSSLVTISNNHFTHHNEVMLLGHSDSYVADKGMYVTIVYNHFGEGLIQRMPRCRHGYFHVVNNDYTHWEMYAIGGSGSPTIFSQGNRFNASNNRYAKHVVHKITPYGNYLSRGDLMMNGAIFNQSGSTNSSSYSKASSLAAKALDLNGIIIDRLTRDAGVLSCTEGKACSV